MNVSDVNQKIHKHKRPQRLGRGKGTGTGKTAGRGHKGQGQLAGWTAHPSFEGGQIPLARRIPKRGFNNRWARIVITLNLSQLDSLFAVGEEISPDALRAKGLLKKRFDVFKVLAEGELTKKLKVSAHRFSEAARAKIEQAGGEVVVLAGPAPVVKNKQATKKSKSK